jgi:hypothetical protein
MKRIGIVLILAVLALSTLTGCGSTEKEGAPEMSIQAIDGGYIGTSTCLGCHDGSYGADKRSFLQSGHPYKYQHTGGEVMGLNTIPGVFTRPVTTTAYLNTATLNGLWVDGNGTPAVLDWSAINYTIGGFGWKLRWGIRDYDQDNGLFTPNPVGNQTGYVWTGLKAQYNLWGVNDSGTVLVKWSDYNATKDKKYECAVCHNTNGIVSTDGYSCRTDAGTDAAPARTQPWAKNPGMGPDTHGGYYSSWTFDGVQCEACHGPGLNHATTNSTLGVLSLPGGVEICAKCHIRAENTAGVGAECGGDADPRILTNGAKISGNFIQHHESYNELVGYNGDGVHSGLRCTTCHDPHKRTIKVVDSIASVLGITDNDLPARSRGAIKASCESCHGNMPVKASFVGRHVDVTCVDCHMAEATKTAINSSTVGWGRKGDLKSHIFRINTTGTAISRTNAEEDLAKTLVANGGSCTSSCDADNDGDRICETNETCVTIATNYITPRYACGKCHDANIGTAPALISGLTSTATETEKETAFQNAADNYHNRR